MPYFILKRVLTVVPLILCVVFVVFAIINVIPGDPGRNILGISASQGEVDALNESLGYSDPFFVRFWNYFVGIVTRFNFGNSYFSGRPVTESIAENFSYTFRLTIMGVMLYVSIGIPLGVMSAVRQYSAADNIARVMAMIVASFPGFWLSMLGMLVFSLWLGWLPSSGVDNWKHYILPVAMFGLSYSAGLLRTTRTTMLEAIRQDYVRTARAKGASERTVVWTHAFRNAMLPIINSVGIAIGVMMGGTLITETIFAMPGLGNLAFTAIQTKDVPLVMGTTIFLSTIFSLMVLLVDVVSAFVDPRVKAKYVK